MCTIISLKFVFESDENRTCDAPAANGGAGCVEYRSTIFRWLSGRFSCLTVVIARRVDGVGVAGELECELELRFGECWGCRKFLTKGEREGRFIAIRPTFISTMAQIKRLLWSTASYN